MDKNKIPASELLRQYSRGFPKITETLMPETDVSQAQKSVAFILSLSNRAYAPSYLAATSHCAVGVCTSTVRGT